VHAVHSGEDSPAAPGAAVEHSILVAIFHMLEHDQPYLDLGGDYFTRRNDPAHRLLSQLEALGYTVHAQPPPAAA
jgi:hypothetical protein